MSDNKKNLKRRNNNVSKNDKSIPDTLLNNLALGAALASSSSLGNNVMDTIINHDNNKSCKELEELYNNCKIDQQDNCQFLKDFISKNCVTK
tara:strand:+ start:183 stop:458 length:276 start_codon:yes stop_codon:yes gene_type:complete